MEATLVLWILQVLLALAFLGAGAGHIVNYERMASRGGRARLPTWR